MFLLLNQVLWVRRRSFSKYVDLNLTDSFEIDDWNCIFKSKSNKRKFKKLFTAISLQLCQNDLKEGIKIYFNGVFDKRGLVKEVHRDQYDFIRIVEREDLELTVGESDYKMFQFVKLMKLTQKKVLIFSLDTDVKMLSIYYTSTLNVEFIVRSGSNIVPSYFHPSKFISQIRNDLKEESLIPTFARSMLKVFALLGCDFLPTFHGVSHSLGMEVFMKMFKRGPVRTPDDFFNSMLKIYQEKYSSFNRLFPQENPPTDPLA